VRIKEGTEASFALVSPAGLVLATFGADCEQRARDEAVRRNLALFRLTTTAEKLPL
jgi:hypothetical protein